MQEAFERRETSEPFIADLRLELRLAESFRVGEIHIDGAHAPAEGVQAKETERADEQSGHREEHHVQQRIIFRVQRIGMRLILREFLRRTRMTFLAGHQNICRRKVRLRVGWRQNVVKAVAVVARGDFWGVICLAEHHCLAVVGVAISCQPVSMALAAAFIADGLEIIARGVGDFMRAVAVNAHRAARVALREQLAVNTFIVSLLDANVTFAAGFGDVGVID